MTNYEKGAAFEREFMKEYEKSGFLAIRTAGSHSMIDVILIPKHEAAMNHPMLDGEKIILCQLKRYKTTRPKPPPEFKDAKFDGAVKWWVTRRDRGATWVEVVQ